MGFKDRIKNAVKSLLGKPLSTPHVSSHDYRLIIEDQGSLLGKTVLVTGGTGGIGSAICYDLAAKGAIVGISGRNEKKIIDTVERIKKESPAVAENLIPVVLDVNKDEQIQKVIREFSENQGKIDVFINNAGGQPGKLGAYNKHLFEQPIDQIDLVLDTNLRGTLLCSREICGVMAKQGFGHIISMASVIGIGGKAGYADYAATKAAIIGLTKSLALEMAEYNVRVNCISPGTINQVPFDSGSEPLSSKLNPMHRAGFTKEIAETVAFLIKNEFITGQNIIVDGGRSLGLYGDTTRWQSD